MQATLNLLRPRPRLLRRVDELSGCVFRIDALNRKPRRSICTLTDVLLESNARIADVFSEYGSDGRDISPIRCKLHMKILVAPIRARYVIPAFDKTRQCIYNIWHRWNILKWALKYKVIQ